MLPALAVARSFSRAPSEFSLEVSWIGSGAPERELVTAAGIPFFAVPSGKLRRYFSLRNVLDGAKILAGIVRAWFLLGRLRPHVVFSKGGFVAFPVAVAARLRGIPVLTHESDATPGLATRLIARFATQILLGTPGDTSWTSTPTTVVGNPVRLSLRNGDAARGRTRFGLAADRPILLVLGGSTGALALYELIVEAAPAIFGRASILHQTGTGKATSFAADGYVQRAFLSEEEMADAFAVADLVVSRSGASAVAELALVHAPCILIPLPRSSSRGDQIANAAPLVTAGAAVVLDQDTLTAQVLSHRALALLDDAPARNELARALGAFAHPDAADTIARIVLDLALERARG